MTLFEGIRHGDWDVSPYQILIRISQRYPRASSIPLGRRIVLCLPLKANGTLDSDPVVVDIIDPCAEACQRYRVDITDGLPLAFCARKNSYNYPREQDAEPGFSHGIPF